MDVILSTENLTKKFGQITAVDHIFLEVFEGDIFGFLGLNGAGKTTTIRMLLGLIRPTEGKIFIKGQETKKNFVNIMSKVGSLVETPAYYPYLSAWENLEIIRLISRNVSRKEISKILEVVGLAERMHDKVKTYSLGMKQRLAIAMALISKPEIVILDEPTNGLDPQGINYIRNLIKEMNETMGTTFFISSHLLHEVELTCNRVGIIKEGKLIVQDRIEKIIKETQGGAMLNASPKQKAIEIIKNLEWVKSVEEVDGKLKVDTDAVNFSRLNAELYKGGVEVSELVPIYLSLEEFFLKKAR
jgi:ABC-2 type transport system ATP-binding protein